MGCYEYGWLSEGWKIQDFSTLKSSDNLFQRTTLFRPSGLFRQGLLHPATEGDFLVPQMFRAFLRATRAVSGTTCALDADLSSSSASSTPISGLWVLCIFFSCFLSLARAFIPWYPLFPRADVIQWQHFAFSARLDVSCLSQVSKHRLDLRWRTSPSDRYLWLGVIPSSLFFIHSSWHTHPFYVCVVKFRSV